MDIILLASSYGDLELTLGLFVAKYGAWFSSRIWWIAKYGSEGCWCYRLKTVGKAFEDKPDWVVSAALQTLCCCFWTQNKRLARGQDSQFTGQSTYQCTALIGSGQCFIWVELVCSTRWLDCALLEKNKRMSWECLPEKLLRLCSPRYSVQWKHLQLVPSLAILRITEITVNFAQKLNKLR